MISLSNVRSPHLPPDNRPSARVTHDSQLVPLRQVQRHLANVYAALAGTVLVCALGAIMDLSMHLGGIGTTLAGTSNAKTIVSGICLERLYVSVSATQAIHGSSYKGKLIFRSLGIISAMYRSLLSCEAGILGRHLVIDL